MKNWLLYIVAMMTSVMGWSQTTASDASAAPSAMGEVSSAEEYFANVKTYKSAESYWSEQVKFNAKNEDAWLNYYKAARYADYTDHSEKISANKKAKLERILSDMAVAIPNSFAWNYTVFLQGNRSDASVANLKKAYELRPSEPELWDEMLAEAVIAKNETEIKSFSKKINDGAVYSEAEMEYNRNVLNSIEKDGVLITNGHVDTYPLIIFQKLFQYRTDVTIVCLDWAGSERYRNSVNATFGDVFESNAGENPYAKLKNLLTKSDRAIYLSLTIPPDVVSSYADHLYCTGLAMKYSTSSLANMSTLVYNWDQLFQKKRIQDAEALNRNYLLPLVQLSNYFKDQGNTARAEEFKNLAMAIGQRFGVWDKIQSQLH